MLINCVVYQDGRKLADIEVDDIASGCVKPDCFVWVALRDATDAELAQMQQEFDLHDLAVEDARHGHQRPKIEEYGDIVFVVMQLLEIERGEMQRRRGRRLRRPELRAVGAQPQQAALPRRARALRARARAAARTARASCSTR